MKTLVPIKIKNFQQGFKYLNFLSMMFLTIMLGTYVLAYKMVSIGNYVQSGGIFIFPLNYALIDIITEVYGFDQTKKIIKNAFFCCLFFATIVPFIGVLPFPNSSSHQESYPFILGNIFRFFIANSIGIAAGFLLNGYLIAKWRILLKGKHFWLRSIVSSFLGELITSIIADLIAFMGTADFSEVIKLMVAICIVKFLYAILLAWPNTLIMLHLKLKEGIINPYSPNFSAHKKKNTFFLTIIKNK